MKRVTIVIVLLALTIATKQATAQQTNTIAKQKFHWGSHQDTAIGYAQAVRVNNMLYISGIAGKGEMATLMKKIYTALEKTLQHYGATFENVVKENLYTTDMEAVKANNNIRKPFYKNDYPAATWVEIKRLFSEEATVEIELVAVLPPS